MGDARRPPRLAAGRARALGVATRGTTNPNRLRRVDRWLTATRAAVLRGTTDPLIVDLGFGASPITTVELYERVRVVRADLRVLGLELAAERVAAAADAARPPALTFARGGFELAGTTPVIVRAMNVLRQYDEAAVVPAWHRMLDGVAPGGLLIEGTCDEIGRRACWFAVSKGWAPAARSGLTLTLSAHLASLDRPSELAERLPKTLIARNRPGEDVHTLFTALDRAWAHAAPLAPFGPRGRFAAAAGALRAAGWPVRDGPRRWRLGELTLDWPPTRPAPAGGGPGTGPDR